MADTPPAAAPADGGGGAEQKKKKVKPPPPPPPAAVMTASAVIRGSLAAVIGQKLGGTCTAVMPILSEAGCGKVSISIKGCQREAELRKGAAEQAAMFAQVEAAVNAAIGADLPVHRITFPDKAAADAAFGGALAEEVAGGGKKDKKGKKGKDGGEEGGAAAAPPPPPPEAEVLYIPGVGAIANATRGAVCASTGVLGAVAFDHGKGGTTVDVGKQARIVVKFGVANADAAGGSSPADAVSDVQVADAAADVAALNEAAVTDEPTKVALEAAAALAEAAAASAASAAAAAAAAEEEEEEDPDVVMERETAAAVAKHAAAVEAASAKLAAALEAATANHGEAMAAVDSLDGGGSGGGAELAMVAAAKEALAAEGAPVTKEGVVAQLSEAHERKTAALKKQRLDDISEASRTLEAEVGKVKASFDKMKVDPWTVEGKIDYQKLINEFGSQLISPELLARIEKLTVGKGRVGRLHRFLRRNIFFSHRDLAQICDLVEKADAAGSKGAPFYLYTGRGPSSAAMHLGHLLPFMMTQWLQEAFDVPLVVQMTDDEKFLWKGEYADGKGDNLNHFAGLTVENAKDIIACGFDKSKTFLFSDLDYVGHMYPNIVRIWKAVTYSQAKACFGFEGKSNIGQSAFPAIQAAPSFPSSFTVPLNDSPNMPCLIPCAIDQDPYFRITRGIAHKIVPPTHPLKGKPSLIHSKFFPPLEGAEGKMSSSNDNSAIFLTDTPEQIQEKITEHAFSGGQMTKKLQEEKGADLDVDVAFQWLCFFMEDDDELERIRESYGSGKGEYWSTALVKNRLIKLLKELVAEHQRKRALVTDEEVREWMSVRSLKC